MLGASCDFDVSETILTEQRNPEETEEVMTSDALKELFNSSVPMESVRMESKPCSKSAKISL